MSRPLFVVEWTTFIPKRGVLLGPGIDAGSPLQVQPGDVIEVRRPDRSVLRTSVVALYACAVTSNAGVKSGQTYQVLLPDEVTKDTIPTGSEVWLAVE